jgi:hypothetical protein
VRKGGGVSCQIETRMRLLAAVRGGGREGNQLYYPETLRERRAPEEEFEALARETRMSGARIGWGLNVQSIARDGEVKRQEFRAKSGSGFLRPWRVPQSLGICLDPGTPFTADTLRPFSSAATP